MKCPMLTMYAITFKKPDEYRDRNCLKEKCAWWQEDDEVCYIVQIGIALSVIATDLGLIRLDTKPQ